MLLPFFEGMLEVCLLKQATIRLFLGNKLVITSSRTLNKIKPFEHKLWRSHTLPTSRSSYKKSTCYHSIHMEITSFNDNFAFSESKPAISVVLETAFSKEIRIAMKAGQIMQEHKTPYPIAVHVLSGHIDFGVSGEVHTIPAGGILTLEGNIPHNLTALQDSIIRLSISRSDAAERVKKVVNP